MARLKWESGAYEAGLDRGVIFYADGSAEPWNGLISVEQNTPDIRELTVYREGAKTANRRSEDSFSATIKAFTYPDPLLSRGAFGFSYRVQNESGYRTHLVYNARAQLAGRNYELNDFEPFTIDISTTPVPVPGAKPSAHLIVTEYAYPWTIEAFEDVLYGTDQFFARLPLPEEILDIFGVNALLQVIDNGDGTWTATGPADAIQMIDDTTFSITWPSAVLIDEETYTIYSF